MKKILLHRWTEFHPTVDEFIHLDVQIVNQVPAIRVAHLSRLGSGDWIVEELGAGLTGPTVHTDRGTLACVNTDRSHCPP